MREAARVLAEAFTDEPLITELLPLGTLHRQRKIADYFVWNMRQTGLRTVDVATNSETEDIVGVALWRAPSQPNRWLPSLQAKPRVLHGVGRRGLRALEEHTAACADRHPSQPYWRLVGVGADPHRLAGVEELSFEAALLRHRLRAIDAEGGLASVETRTPEHVTLYESVGFEPQRQFGERSNTTVLWREPALVAA